MWTMLAPTSDQESESVGHAGACSRALVGGTDDFVADALGLVGAHGHGQLQVRQAVLQLFVHPPWARRPPPPVLSAPFTALATCAGSAPSQLITATTSSETLHSLFHARLPGQQPRVRRGAGWRRAAHPPAAHALQRQQVVGVGPVAVSSCICPAQGPGGGRAKAALHRRGARGGHPGGAASPPGRCGRGCAGRGCAPRRWRSRTCRPTRWCGPAPGSPPGPRTAGPASG